MGMFNKGLTDKAEVVLAIKHGKFYIEFENDQYIKEDIEISQNKKPNNYILIRNKYTGGHNNKPISHNMTFKYIRGGEFNHNGDLGLPFDLIKGESPKISRKANTADNKKKLNNKDMKFINLIWKENEDEIQEYWDLNPDNHDDKIRMKEIENIITNKYGSNRVNTKKTPK